MLQQLINVKGFNLDYDKRIDFICILSFIFITMNESYRGYLDMNILYDEFYKSEDFKRFKGASLVERYVDKAGIEKPESIKFPRFDIRTTSAMADVINYFLEYIYSNNIERKKTAIKKIRNIYRHLDINTEKDLADLENMLIRFLLRNIFFLEKTGRKDEQAIILQARDIEIPEIIAIDRTIGRPLEFIINGQNYQRILKSISSSTDKKQEISEILKNYK